MRRLVIPWLVLLSLAGCAGMHGGRPEGRDERSAILFGGGTAVPRPVQELAWHVIEARCDYQSWERKERSFFFARVKATNVGAGIVYAITITSDEPWDQEEPPAFVDMTIVDDGGLRLTALTSSFVDCVL